MRPGSRSLLNIANVAPESFVQRIHPCIRLVIIGEGPDSAPFAKLAELLGWESIALENITQWKIEPDERTAVIVKTHNYGRDCAALRYLLPFGLPYVGVIGPRRRRDELLSDALDSGATITSALFAPAGRKSRFPSSPKSRRCSRMLPASRCAIAKLLFTNRITRIHRRGCEIVSVKIAATILAAGGSSRLGQPKQLLEVRTLGNPVLAPGIQLR